MENAFTLLPMSQTAALTPGKTYEGYITIANPKDAKADFHYVASVVPYSVAGDSYEADLSTTSTWSQIVNWTEIENPTGTIAPNDLVKVKFKITVPLDAPAGGQYAAITVRSDNEAAAADGVTVNNIFEMASIIYAEVAGETVREGEIIDNNIPAIVTQVPLTVSTTLSNSGNIHTAAVVKIKVRNAITGETIFPVENDAEEFNEIVMPGTTREVKREVGRLADLGIYEITQEVSYLGDKSVTSHLVFTCPIWFMVLVAILIATIIGTLIRMALRRREISGKGGKSRGSFGD